jgi:phosphoserine phosphatase
MTQLQVKKELNAAMTDLGSVRNRHVTGLRTMKNLRLRLVSFDVDWTVLQGRILEYVKIPKDLHDKIAAVDKRFFQGKLGYEETCEVEFSLFEGLKADEIAPDPEKLPLIRDLEATLEKLKNSGVRVVMLTDNPSFAVQPLRVFGFQDVIATEAESSNGILTGRMKLLANKLSGLREYCQRQRIEMRSCAHVGDWINDIVVFKGVGLSVAFNTSDEEVAKAATHVVRSDSLLDVYRVLEPYLPGR